MTFEEHMTEFAGLPIMHFPQDAGWGLTVRGLTPDTVAWRIAVDPEGEEYSTDIPAELGPIFEHFLEKVDPAQVTTLVFGPNTEAEHDLIEPVEVLARHADRFPALRALFLGDIVREESEVSWICAVPLDSVFKALPGLEILGVRGNFALGPEYGKRLLVPRFEPTGHHALRSLTVQCGGLPSGILAGILACDLPNLEHLELYLGDPHYDGDATVDDLAVLLDGGVFPKLRSLGLKDSVLQNEIAAALAHAPLVARLEALDLSLGVLGDEGADALLAGQSLTHLRKLDLHHHFLREVTMARLRAALPGVELDLSDRQEPDRDDWNPTGRYIAVSE